MNALVLILVLSNFLGYLRAKSIKEVLSGSGNVPSTRVRKDFIVADEDYDDDDAREGSKEDPLVSSLIRRFGLKDGDIEVVDVDENGRMLAPEEEQGPRDVGGTARETIESPYPPETDIQPFFLPVQLGFKNRLIGRNIITSFFGGMGGDSEDMGGGLMVNDDVDTNNAFFTGRAAGPGEDKVDAPIVYEEEGAYDTEDRNEYPKGALVLSWNKLQPFFMDREREENPYFQPEQY